MPPGALADVSVKDGARLHVFQTELAQEQLWQPGVLLRVGAGVPGGDVKLSKLDHLRSADVRASRTASLYLGTLRHRGQGISHRCGCGCLSSLWFSRCFFPFHTSILNSQESFRLLLTFCEKLDIFLSDSGWQGGIQTLFIPS